MNRQLLHLVLLLLLAACVPVTNDDSGVNNPAGAPLQPDRPAGVTTPTPPPAAPLITENLPTPFPSVTPPPSTTSFASLPAPLYFVSDQGQLLRLEADGLMLTTVVPALVAAYDLAPQHGRLAMLQPLPGDTLPVGPQQIGVTAPRMELTVADAFGRDARPIDAPYVAPVEVSMRWSPDGRYLAYPTVDGVTLYDAARDEVRLALRLPDPGAEQFTAYNVVAWSPDGSRLLLQVSDIPGYGWRLAVADIATGAVVMLQQPCCHPRWSADGTAVYLDGSAYPHGILGLFRADATTGEVTALLGGDLAAAPPSPFVYFPHERAGTLHFFWQEFMVENEPPAAVVMVADADTAPLRFTAVLNQSRLFPTEVVWSETGVVARDYAGGWMWLPFAGETAVPLPVAGSKVQWGR